MGIFKLGTKGNAKKKGKEAVKWTNWGVEN